MWPWKRRNPLSGKGSGAYHVPMSSDTARRVSEGPAVPLSLTVLRSSGAWVLQVWYHGSTVHEALHPVLVAENVLDPREVPTTTSWRTLWFNVAAKLVDLAEGEVSAHYQA